MTCLMLRAQPCLLVKRCSKELEDICAARYIQVTWYIQQESSCYAPSCCAGEKISNKRLEASFDYVCNEKSAKRRWSRRCNPESLSHKLESQSIWLVAIASPMAANPPATGAPRAATSQLRIQFSCTSQTEVDSPNISRPARTSRTSRTQPHRAAAADRR